MKETMHPYAAIVEWQWSTLQPAMLQLSTNAVRLSEATHLILGPYLGSPTIEAVETQMVKQTLQHMVTELREHSFFMSLRS